MEDELMSIEFKLSDRSYPVQIEFKRINDIRTLERNLNTKLDDYKSEYPDLDLADALSMILISYAFELDYRNNILAERLSARMQKLSDRMADKL